MKKEDIAMIAGYVFDEDFMDNHNSKRKFIEFFENKYLLVFKNYILPHVTAQLKNKTIMKQGDILKRNGEDRKVLGICGDAVMVSRINDFNTADVPWTINELIDAGYEIPKQKFIPQSGQNVWYIETDGEVTSSRVWNTSYYQDIIDLGNCFETKEEAEKVAEEIKKIYKNAHDK